MNPITSMSQADIGRMSAEATALYNLYIRYGKWNGVKEEQWINMFFQNKLGEYIARHSEDKGD